MIYVVLYVILFIFSLIEISKPKTVVHSDHIIRFGKIKLKYIYLFLLAFILILVAGTRYNVGIDYASYLKEFEYTKYSLDNVRSFFDLFSLNFKNEITCYIIFWLCKSFNMVLLVYSIISIVPKTIILAKTVAYPVIGLLIYFTEFYLGADMGIIRQCAAMSIVLLAIKAIIDKDIKRYIICIVIAFLFHRSAILFAPAYLVNVFNIKPKRAAFFATLSVFFVGLDFSKMLNTILDIVPDALLGKYVTKSFEYSESGFGITTLYRVVLFWIYTFIIEGLEDVDQKTKRVIDVSYKIMFIGTCGFYVFRSVYSISGRGMFYYFLVAMILIPVLLSSIKNAKKRLICYAIIIGLYSFMYFNGLINYINLIEYDGYSLPYVPYKSYLFQ